MPPLARFGLPIRFFTDINKPVGLSVQGETLDTKAILKIIVEHETPGFVGGNGTLWESMARVADVIVDFTNGVLIMLAQRCRSPKFQIT